MDFSSEEWRKELEKKTNKDLLVDLAVRTAVLEERSQADSDRLKDATDYLKSLNGKATAAGETALKAYAKSEQAIKISCDISSHLNKIQVVVIGAGIAAIMALAGTVVSLLI